MRTDWDTYWRYERLHRLYDPVDFRRWKRASQRALRERFAGERVRVLDATAGLGDHTVNLAELGFRVDACDASAEAREATREALQRAHLADAVSVFEARWEELGALCPSRYDLVFHDALHWIEEPAAMRASLRGLREALVPGGSLVFFFADAREPDAGAGMRLLAWDRAHLAPHEFGWEHPIGEAGRVTHVRVNVAHEAHIDQHHVYVLRDEQGHTRLDSVVLRRIYRWDYHAMRAVLAECGFGPIESCVCQNDKGHSFAMNFAARVGDP